MTRQPLIENFGAQQLHKAMDYQLAQLEKIQLQSLLVSAQSFIDQFGIRKLDQIHSYIDLRDDSLYPCSIKKRAKEIFATDFR